MAFFFLPAVLDSFYLLKLQVIMHFIYLKDLYVAPQLSGSQDTEQQIKKPTIKYNQFQKYSSMENQQLLNQ